MSKNPVTIFLLMYLATIIGMTLIFTWTFLTLIIKALFIGILVLIGRFFYKKLLKKNE